MKRWFTICGLVLLAASAGAQDRESRRERSASTLPRSVVEEVIDLYNAPNTMRVDGSLEIVIDREVRGDIAVLNGPLTIAGHVRGRVVAINADVLLKPGARIDEGITVVGGVVEGRNDAYVSGEIRTYREVLYFRRDGDQIVAERAPRDDERDDDWWDRRSRRKRTRNVNRLTLVSAKTYNRVEGLPVYFGPYMRHEYGALQFKLDLFGVIRTADNLKFDDSKPGADNFGHNVRAEIKLGPIGIGGRAYDVIEGVENWQLTDPEVGLASFFLHRDFRDYYNRHGASVFAALYAGQKADLTFSYSGERWASREARDPWTLFRNGEQWRANPAMENTLVHVVGANLRIDTRNDREDPTTGWLIDADFEHGVRESDTLTMEGARQLFDIDAPAYNRGFLDLRRYNRLTPGAQLNFRVVMGGWMGQQTLPLQRRLSVPGGAGSMPGFDFRRPAGDLDLGTCNTTAHPELPANCDRIMLGQVEYRGNLHIDLFGWDPDDLGLDGDSDPTWVLFADAGRGWLVGAEADGKLRYKTSDLPAFTSFRTDAGIGLEFDGFGVFMAKALSPATEPPNFFVRLRHRF